MLEGIIVAPGRSDRDAMSHEAVLTVLPDSKEEGRQSIKEIAMALGLEISPMWIGSGRRVDWSGLWELRLNGAGLPVTRSRTKKATSYRTTPTGRRELAK
jgi:hypothetical protein